MRMQISGGATIDIASGEEVGALRDEVRRLSELMMSRPNAMIGLWDRRSTVLDGTGAGTERWTNDNSAATLVVRRISAIASPVKTSGCTCLIEVQAGFLNALKAAGDGETMNMGDAPVVLRPGGYLDFTWSGGDANGTGVVTIFYDRLLEVVPAVGRD